MRQEELNTIEMELERVSRKRRFKLYPKEYNCTFDKDLIMNVDDITATGIPKKAKRKCRVKVKQFPVNLNDATTGHKLQGMSKDMLIVNQWMFTQGWPYTNLSRVRRLDGLFLTNELNPNIKQREEAIHLSRELIQFEKRMRLKVPEELRTQDDSLINIDID